jgi:hypothetical protein
MKNKKIQAFISSIIILLTLNYCKGHSVNNLNKLLLATYHSSTPEVIIPENPDGKSPINIILPGINDQVSIKESDIQSPASINYHYYPIGKVYDIEIIGHEDGYNFVNQYAELHYKYDKDELANAGLVEDFNVYYFDQDNNIWKPVDFVVVDEDHSEVIAYTSHLTPFILCAATDPWIKLGGKIYFDPNNFTIDPSICFDGTTPYVTYLEFNKSHSYNRIYVKKWDNDAGKWSDIGGLLNNNINGYAYSPSISVNASTPYVAFSELNESVYQIIVKQWSGSEWIQIGSPLNVKQNESAYNPQIIFIGFSRYVSWIENDGSSTQIYVKYWNGSDWALLGNSLNIHSSGEVFNPSITYNGTSLFVSWVEKYNEKFNSFVKSWDGANWIIVGNSINDNSNCTIDYQTIASDNSNLYIAYHESYTGSIYDSIKVKKLIDNKWMQIGDQLNRISSLSSWSPSIIMARSKPYVAWFEVVNDICHIYVSHWNGKVWQKDGDTLNVNKTRSTSSPYLGFNGMTFFVSLFQYEKNTEYVYVKAGNWNETLNEDPTCPSITKFVCTSTMPVTSHTISVDLEGRDNKGITGWMITDNPIKPSYDSPKWLSEKPTEISSDYSSSKVRLFAWAKDGDGNVSDLYYSINVDLVPWNKAITSFSFTKAANPGLSADAIGFIDDTNITVTVPEGTDITNLVANFIAADGTVSVNGVAQVSGVTGNNFTDDVTYTLTASDSTTKDYIITVIVPGAYNITSFSFTKAVNPGLFEDAIGIIDGNNITVNVPERTDIRDLVATFTTTGKTVSVNGFAQVSGFTRNNFTGHVTYTVTAKDATTKDYVITVLVSPPMEAQWARTVIASNNVSYFNNVSVASDGSVYAAGYITGTGTFVFGDSATATGTNSNYNIVLVKYNSYGVAQWAKTVTAGSSNSYFASVSVASDGSVYAAGYITGTGTYNFGNGVVAAGTNSSNNIVLVKYNSSGAAQWATTVTAGSTNSSFGGASVASDSSVYAAGSIMGGTYNFGNGVTAASTSSTGSILLVKYNSSGVAQWAKTVTAGSSSSYFRCVSVASDSSVYAAGRMQTTDSLSFGNGVTAAAGTYDKLDILLVKYDNSGAAQWAKTATSVGSSASDFYNISAALDGSVYAAGNLMGGTYNFGNGVTVTGANSGVNMLLVKYDSYGAAQWAKTVPSGSFSSLLTSVSAALDGSVYAAGYIRGSGTYDFGNDVMATGPSSGFNIILVKYNSYGAAQWAKTVNAGSISSYFNSVSAASDGSVHAVGYIYGTDTYNFGNGVTATGPFTKNNILLVKYR